MRAPNRYNTNRAHRHYGFDKWFRAKKWKGVHNVRLLEEYMEHVGADVPALAKRWKTEEYDAMLIRIGHDWQHFTQWAAKWYKELQRAAEPAELTVRDLIDAHDAVAEANAFLNP